MRKRLTEMMPFLIPLRVWQRDLFYNIAMFFDENKYAHSFLSTLPFQIVEEKTVMINENSGQDMVYQQNKVDNLKIASQTMNGILIKPGETFSFCYLERKSKKYGKYKDGLVLVNGKIEPQKGGGICHLSNLLYSMFLKTPLTIVERHGHKVKSLPNPDLDSISGIDATINRGWLDLKVRNDTDAIFQIILDFDSVYMYGKIYSSKESFVSYEILNKDFKYIRKNDKIYESVSVIRIEKDKKDGNILSKKKLYDEVVEVTYELPKNIIVEE